MNTFLARRFILFFMYMMIVLILFYIYMGWA